MLQQRRHTLAGRIARRTLVSTVFAALLAGIAVPVAAQYDDPFGDIVTQNPGIDTTGVIVANPGESIPCDATCQATLANPATMSDLDGDSLIDADEVNIYGTNPNLFDTDGDGIDDGTEINLYGTNPTLKDTDRDGLNDNDEFVYGTAPLVWDTDGDGTADGCDPTPAIATPEELNSEPLGCISQS